MAEAGVMLRDEYVTRVIRDGDWRSALDAVARGRQPVLLHAPDARLAGHVESYVSAALAFADLPGIAGATLSLPRWRASDHVPFAPIPDGADTLYLQAGAQVAVVVTPAQAERALAGGVRGEDWSAYLAATGQFLLAPVSALATGPGRGLQAMLAVGERVWRIHPLDDAVARYDARLELTAAAAAMIDPRLAGIPARIDLWGTGPATGADDTALLISSRPCSRPMAGYPLELAPVEANLALRRDQGFFSLGRAADFGEMTPARREALFRHATRYNALGDYAAQFLGPVARILGRLRS